MWTEVTLAGKRIDVFQPASKPRFGLLFLHGIGQETLRGNEVYAKLFEHHRLACVSPIAGRCWWADRVCAEFDPVLTAEKFLLQSVVPWMRDRWQLAPRALGVFGISMGGQGALRLAFKQPATFPTVAGISSALDYHELYGQGYPLDDMYDSSEQCRQDTAILHVPPVHYPPHIYFCIDPEDIDWYRGNDRLSEKLSALGIEHTADLTTSAGGHSWEYFNHMADPVLRFMVAGLEKESWRLV